MLSKEGAQTAFCLAYTLKEAKGSSASSLMLKFFDGPRKVQAFGAAYMLEESKATDAFHQTVLALEGFLTLTAFRSQ